jgi:hypothetical protein
MPLVVTADKAPIREYDLGAGQSVRRQTVCASEDPEPTAQGEPGDPNVGSTAGRQ